MGHLDEETALGGAFGIDGDRRGDVGAQLDIGARLSRHGQVHGGVGERAGLGRGEEILDQGAEAVQLGRCRVPTEQDLAGVGLEVEGQHVLLVLDIDLDLVLVLGMGDGEGRDHGDVAAILGPAADQGADDARRRGWCGGDVTADGMVEDGEDGLEKREERAQSACIHLAEAD